MHGSRASVTALATALRSGLPGWQRMSAVVFPVSLHLQTVSDILREGPVAFGVQNIYPAISGAFTGELSAPMAAELGCQYALIGHSERRQLFGETAPFIAAKCQAALQAGLKPVLCVGETREERDTGQTEQVIRDQLASVMAVVGVTGFQAGVIAYEPVWAIGTGLTATPEQAQAVHAFIRQWLRQHDAALAEKTQILYGGSVKASNAGAIFAMPDVDGALIGGASLSAEEFLAICHAAR